MQLVARHEDREQELDVRLTDGVTLAEVARAVLGDADAPALFVDGKLFSVDLPVGDLGIHAGGTVASEAPPGPAPGVGDLRVVAGPGAGMSVRLVPGLHVIGSGPGANVAVRAPGVRPRHAVVRIGAGGDAYVAAGGAAWRPLVPAGLLRIGGCLLSWLPAGTAVAPLRSVPGRRGTVPFNRPPRRVVTDDAAVVEVPAPPKPPAPRTGLGVAALIVPILFGLTMAVVVHPRMALFAFLGPVMMLAGRLDDRRRSRRFRRTSAIEAASAAEAVGDAIDRARVAEVLRRHRTCPSLPDLRVRSLGHPRLWERRPAAGDFMRLLVGYGRPAWRPQLTGDPTTASTPVREAIARRRRLPMTAVTLDLGAGQVAGIAGAPGETIELVRGLVTQAAVLHGPADLRIAVVTDRPDTWDWVKWLPHASLDGGGERRLLAGTPEEVARLVTVLTPPAPQPPPASLVRGGPAQPGLPGAEPLTLLVVDLPDLAAPWLAGLRGLLAGRGGPIAGIVVAAATTALPSVCTSVTLVRGGVAQCTGSEDGEVAVVPAAVGEDVARAIARNLARFDDPERCEPGAELPAAVSLLDIAGMGRPSAEAVSARWRSAGRIPPIAAPIGVTEAGPLVIDLVADGPHALLAGTTGSGKSELLRTLVASLAVAVDPEHLTFVLIDYKGGSAFDVCAALPHTVGVVTDLDDRLAERALRCLEAELRHREARLRTAGADDLAAYLALGAAEPLPRMLIVIDEFAALAKELPEFMDALVDIAARGRSLGVHLLLATQRPAGVIRDNVRANTNLRVALRVQDRADSTDVIGDPGAAAIARGQAGRGFVRLGPGEVVPFQAAQVTGPVRSGGAPAVWARPFRFALEQDPFTAASPVREGDGAPTELEAIVAAVVAAADGMTPPRRPWPEPLPDRVEAAELPPAERPGPGAVALGLRDEPDQQRQTTHWWDPDDGPLVLYGLTGSGTTTGLTTIATGLAGSGSPSELHMYVLDFDAGATGALAGLPHVGAAIGPLERERQVRLIRRLAAEVDLRKGDAGRAGVVGEAGRPRIVLLIDNYAGFTAAFEAALDTPVREALGRIITEGPGVGVVTVLTASRTNAVPLALASAIPNKIVFRMADPLAATTLGLRGIPTDLPDGRAIDVQSRREIQVALPHRRGLAAAVEAIRARSAPRDGGGPQPVEELPVQVPLDRVAHRFGIGADEWFVPVGIGDRDLTVVGLALAPGDHVYVAGEPRSGKSSLLAAIGAMALRAPTTAQVTAVALRPSPLRDVGPEAMVIDDPDALPAALEALESRDGPQLLLIDDADALDDPGILKRLAASRRPGFHVVAAGRRDVKTQYQHWAKDLCRSRIGVWLRPSPGLDGDLWSTPMPRHVPSGIPPGRGYLVAGGTVELVHAARR